VQGNRGEIFAAEVRRMTAAAGFPTLRLVRWSIGDWTVDGIEPGSFAELSV